MPTYRLLVVDDELRFLATLQRVLPDAWSIRPCLSAYDALACVARGEHFDAMVVDVMMPGMDGPRMVEKLPEHLARRVLFVTGGPATAETRRALVPFADRVLEKPFTTDALVRALDRIVDASSAA